MPVCYGVPVIRCDMPSVWFPQTTKQDDDDLVIKILFSFFITHHIDRPIFTSFKSELKILFNVSKSSMFC